MVVLPILWCAAPTLLHPDDHSESIHDGALSAPPGATGPDARLAWRPLQRSTRVAIIDALIAAAPDECWGRPKIRAG
jgi:hypothetical protein